MLKALNKLRQRNPGLVPPAPQFEDMLQAELMGYYRSFQILAAFDPRAGAWQPSPQRESLLARALRERMEYELERIFRLLALLYPPQDVHNAFAGLTSQRPQLQANAVEVLEHLLRPELYRLLVYVVDPEVKLGEKLAFAQRLCHTSVSSRAEALRVLLHSEDRWLRACALHSVGELQVRELSADVEQFACHDDPLLEETWNWTSNRLAAAAAV